MTYSITVRTQRAASAGQKAAPQQCRNDLTHPQAGQDKPEGRSAQTAGFTLDQIGELLALDAGEDRARARELATERLGALDRTIAELEQARAALRRLANACSETTTGPCPIISAFQGMSTR